MDFQAAGPFLELIYGEKWFVAGGFHAGAVITDVLQRSGDYSETKVQNGLHFKSSGYFLAPYISAGIYVKSSELRIYVKHVCMFSSEKEAINSLNAWYGGLSWGYFL